MEIHVERVGNKQKPCTGCTFFKENCRDCTVIRIENYRLTFQRLGNEMRCVARAQLDKQRGSVYVPKNIWRNASKRARGILFGRHDSQKDVQEKDITTQIQISLPLD